MAEFLGSNIGISNVRLVGGDVTFTAVFQDTNGVIHGHMEHSLPLTENKALHKAAAALVAALTRATQRAHYTGIREERAHGIAEALRGAATEVERAEDDGI